MHSRLSVIVALGACAILVDPAAAGIGATLHWTFNGLQCEKIDVLPGQKMTVGLRATWVDTDHMATAFGALVGIEINITGETGTSRLDIVDDLGRVAPFNFGAVGLDGLLIANPDSFFISGIGPAQNQFDSSNWNHSSPTSDLWTFSFTAGPEANRTVALDIASLDNALLFVAAGQPAITVPGGLVQTYQGLINIIVVPAPGAMGLLALGVLGGCRRRRR